MVSTWDNSQWPHVHPCWHRRSCPCLPCRYEQRSGFGSDPGRGDVSWPPPPPAIRTLALSLTWPGPEDCLWHQTERWPPHPWDAEAAALACEGQIPSWPDWQPWPLPRDRDNHKIPGYRPGGSWSSWASAACSKGHLYSLPPCGDQPFQWAYPPKAQSA